MDGITICPTGKEVTLNSSENGIYNYTLTLSGINARGTLELKVKATDNAGNTNSEIILKPGITLEETLTPITMPKDFVASIETEGHPETAVKYATLAEAIAQSSDGKVIKLLTSFVESVTIESGKVVKLDLNGNSVGTTTSSISTIVNSGNL